MDGIKSAAASMLSPGLASFTLQRSAPAAADVAPAAEQSQSENTKEELPSQTETQTATNTAEPPMRLSSL